MLTGQIGNSTDTFSQYKERVASLSTNFELGLFFFLLRKNIIWIILFFTIAFAGAYVYLRYTPKVFQSKSVLQINTENEATKVLNVSNVYESQNGIAKSIELLRSKVFFAKTLSTLPLKVTYFVEGTFRKNEHYKVSAYVVDADVINPAAYGIRINIYFKNQTEGEINYGLAGKLYSFRFRSGEWLKTPEMNLKISINDFSELDSQQSAVKDNTFYFVVNDFDALANDYFSRLNIRLLNDAAKTIEISFEDNNPSKATDIVSAMANQFRDYDVKKKGESAEKILSFLDDQLAVVSERVQNTESSIYSFKKDNKITDSKATGETGGVRLNSFEDELIALELKENVLTELEKSMDEKKDMDTYQLISLLTSVELQSVLSSQINSLQSLLKTKESLLYEVTPTSEKIKSVDFQIGVQKKLLIASIHSIRDQLSSRKKSLEVKLKELTGKIYTTAPNEEMEYSRLQRVFAINEKFYNLLLDKRTEYSISQAGNVSQHEVLDKAMVPSVPVSPQKTIVVSTWFAIAFLLSLLLTFARYITYNEINSVSELNKLTSAAISVLGIVPRYK